MSQKAEQGRPKADRAKRLKFFLKFLKCKMRLFGVIFNLCCMYPAWAVKISSRMGSTKRPPIISHIAPNVGCLLGLSFVNPRGLRVVASLDSATRMCSAAAALGSSHRRSKEKVNG